MPMKFPAAHHDIRCVVLDLDGTLLNRQGQLTAANLASVRACRRRGVPVVVATGRPPRAVRPLFDPVGGLGGFAIYYDGALTRQEADGTAFEHRGVDGARVVAISRWVAEQYPAAIITYEVEDRWCCVHPVPDSRYAELNMAPGDPLPDVVDWTYLQTHPATAIIISSLPGPLPPNALGAKVRVLPVGDGRMVQVRDRSASKERALRSVLHALAIAPAHTLAIGDGLNDLGLLGLCGVSVAMGNAPEVVKEAATHTTASQDEDGVAQALGALGLANPEPSGGRRR